MKILNEETAKGAQDIKLEDFERSEFWKDIRANKMVTIGCDVNFQTVAYSVIPKISNEAIEVVSDKVAKLEYSDEKVEKTTALKTFGDFQTLMKTTESWKDLKGSVKWLGNSMSITLKFPKDLSEYNINDKASDIKVEVWLRNEENNIKEGRQPTQRSYTIQPIPIDLLFLNTYTAQMAWYRQKSGEGESVNRAKQNIDAWNEGKTKPKEQYSVVTVKSFVDAFDGETQSNGSYIISIPQGDPQFTLTIPKIDPRSSLEEIPKIFILEKESNITNTYDGEYIFNQFYKNNKIKDVMEIVSNLIKIFGGDETDEEPTILIPLDKVGDIKAEDFFSKYLRINNLKGEGTLKRGGGKLGMDLYWTYTTPSSNITYKINLNYSQGDILKKNEAAISIEHEGKKYIIGNNSMFFHSEYVVIKTSQSGKSFSFSFKQPTSETKWWKALVAKTGTDGKTDIKMESFIKQLDSMGFIEKKSGIDYWDKQNFKQDTNKEYWENYWKEMGF